MNSHSETAVEAIKLPYKESQRAYTTVLLGVVLLASVAADHIPHIGHAWWFDMLQSLFLIVVCVRAYRIPFSWKIDKHQISFSGGGEENFWVNWDIENVEVVDFSPADFSGEFPNSGVSDRFRGVTGYFKKGTTKGVLIRTHHEGSILLGFNRPNYAAAIISHLIKKEIQNELRC